MTLYHVVWTIDLEADSPQEAAEKARDIAIDDPSAEQSAMRLLDVYEVTGYERAPYEYLCGVDLDAAYEGEQLPYVCQCGERYADPLEVRACLATNCCEVK
jgi:hypothetical protein